jgi:hypothetical protein
LAHYGCSTARNKGTCDNLLTVRRDELEAKVLDGLKDQLMHPELVTTFIEEFHREVNRQRAEQDGCRDRAGHDLEKAERTLEARRIKLHAQLGAAPLPCHACIPTLLSCTARRS